MLDKLDSSLNIVYNTLVKVDDKLIVQGRQVIQADIERIKQLMRENPNWNRTRLSKELCKEWDWYKENGQIKDMSCRSLLLKLEKQGYIKLPPSANPISNRCFSRYVEPVLHGKEPVGGPLKQLQPVNLKLIERGEDLKLFKYFISAYHYLGWSGTVGENLKYLFFDKYQRPLGCMMFGAAAWKIMPRDSYIGWEAEVRKRNLLYIANNNRYLLLPWVRVDHLASHVLGKICKRINQDWLNKYNHPLYLLETFVCKERFKGTCYNAANWIYVGDTKGRGKLDVKNEYPEAIKTIWLYPLVKEFKDKLVKERTQAGQGKPTPWAVK